MKTSMLRIVSIGVLILRGGISAGAPAPADLTEVASLKMPRPSRVADPVFSPDGKTLFSLDQNGNPLNVTISGGHITRIFVTVKQFLFPVLAISGKL